MPDIDPSLYKLMADRVQDYAIFLLDTEGRVLTWNAGAERVKRYAPAEIIGKHFSVFYTAEDIARRWPTYELERALMEGRFEDDGWRVRKDGTRFWANVIITALRDDAGTLLAYSKITRDLTERKNQDEFLRRSEERFRLLVDGVSDYAIYMLDPEGRVASWNSGARRIKGYKDGEILGKHFSRFYKPTDIAAGKPWMELAQARDAGRAEDEGWRVRKDGSVFWAKVVVTALYDESGKLHGYAKVTQDMTKARHSAALEATTKSVTDFIAILAHELRNPLAPIRNAVTVLKLAKPDDPGRDKMLHAIDRQSAQLARIVDDILDISRVTRGALEIRRAYLPVCDVIARAVEAAGPEIHWRHHVLDVDLPVEPVAVDGDEVRLTQALTNLLINAARYSEDRARIVIKVSVQDSDRSESVAISVKDTGRGIDPALMGTVFGMFVQGKDAMNREGGGLGVGLALAKSIVELHQGTLEGNSEGVGKGSEFIIRLPVRKTKPGLLQVVPRADEQAVQPIRILVVDDNVDAAIALSDLLRTKFGHQVKTVHSGVDALAEYDFYRPEVVLLDLGMPGMNGLEVARRMRNRGCPPEPTIVAVTGWGTAEDMTKSRDAGFDSHLVKPVEEGRLAEIFRFTRSA